MNRRGFGPKVAPVREGDELDVKIEAVGEKGDGIAKKEGFVLFVPGTKEGQDVKVKVTRVLRNVGFAEVVGDAESKPEEQPQEESEEQQETEAAEQPEESGEESSEESPAEDTEDFGEETEEKKE